MPDSDCCEGWWTGSSQFGLVDSCESGVLTMEASAPQCACTQIPLLGMRRENVLQVVWTVQMKGNI